MVTVASASIGVSRSRGRHWQGRSRGLEEEEGMTTVVGRICYGVGSVGLLGLVDRRGGMMVRLGLACWSGISVLSGRVTAETALVGREAAFGEARQCQVAQGSAKMALEPPCCTSLGTGTQSTACVFALVKANPLKASRGSTIKGGDQVARHSPVTASLAFFLHAVVASIGTSRDGHAATKIPMSPLPLIQRVTN